MQAFGRPVCRPSLTCLARPDTGWTNRPSGQSHEPRPLPLLRDLPQTARWRPELPHPLGLSTSLQQTSQPTKPCPLQNLLRDHKSGSRSYCTVMRAHVYTHTHERGQALDHLCSARTLGFPEPGDPGLRPPLALPHCDFGQVAHPLQASGYPSVSRAIIS